MGRQKRRIIKNREETRRKRRGRLNALKAERSMKGGAQGVYKTSKEGFDKV